MPGVMPRIRLLYLNDVRRKYARATWPWVGMAYRLADICMTAEKTRWDGRKKRRFKIHESMSLYPSTPQHGASHMSGGRPDFKVTGPKFFTKGAEY